MSSNRIEFVATLNSPIMDFTPAVNTNQVKDEDYVSINAIPAPSSLIE